MSLKIVFILGISVPAFEKFNSQSKINLLLGTAISYGGRRGGLAVLQGIKFSRYPFMSYHSPSISFPLVFIYLFSYSFLYVLYSDLWI